MEHFTNSFLQEIANLHGIHYIINTDREAPRCIKTALSKDFDVEASVLFELLADPYKQSSYLSNIKSTVVVSCEDLDNAIDSNQFILVEGLAEGAARMAIRRMTLLPPNIIDNEVYSDLFSVNINAAIQDRKSGSFRYEVKYLSESSSRLEITSTFNVTVNSSYIQSTIDHVWMDFIENIMVDLGQLKSEEKSCRPIRAADYIKNK